MGTIISAYRQPGGIQIHEDNGDGTMLARYVEEGAEGWLAALAALPSEDQVIEPDAPRLLEAVKIATVAGLNRVCGQIRSSYVTVIPGQEMIYLAKENEAVRFLADPLPDMMHYPMLSAETGITAATTYELAQIWVNMSALWRQVASAIEAIRMTAIYGIEDSTDEAQVDAVLQEALLALSVF